MVETLNERRASSPASTGGAGTSFEQHVAAYWLAQLLVRGIPPILIDTVVTEVSFQTGRLGWQTDDFLIVYERPGGAPQKLAGQVKRHFTVSAANDECVQAIGDFWQDFNGAHFSTDNDRLVLVTLRGTNTLLEHFVGLLDCARASRDGAEFEQRLAADGFISDQAVRYCRELQKTIGDLEGKTVTAADIWPFLRVLHVLNLDLHSSTRQTEAHIKSLLAHTVTDGDAVAGAAASWNELVGVASMAMAEARTLRRADLPAALQERHAPISSNEQRVLRALKDHTSITLRGIRSTIGSDFHLQRAALLQRVLGALEDAQVVLVAGPAGSGKSAIGKDAVTLLAQDHFAFAFRVEEFAESHLDRTLTASNVPANAATLGATRRAGPQGRPRGERGAPAREDHARRVQRSHDVRSGRPRHGHYPHVPRLFGRAGAHEFPSARTHQPCDHPRVAARRCRVDACRSRASGARHPAQQPGAAQHPAQPVLPRQGAGDPVVGQEAGSGE